jgi:hypothetical protein
MTQRQNKNSEFTNLIMIVLIASMPMIGVLVGVSNNSSTPLPMANAQVSWHAMFGTIASIQNDESGQPAWVTSGIWDFDNINTDYPIFNATFEMFMLNGSAAHRHNITDIEISSNPTTRNNVTIYNGTATVSLKQGPATDVPISIKLMGDSAVSISIDPNKTENHFGNTPIYGGQHRLSPGEPQNY